MQSRKIKRILKAKPTLEGAGVHLHRVFGFNELPDFDPFLMLDDFSSDVPQDYQKGFPWHPHRGMETITYVLKGEVEHRDNLGNKGVIGAGDIQWMTAGSGIIHQEMPQGDSDGSMHGFQVWANLPAADKMMDPRYRGILSHEIPMLKLENGIQIRVIAGTINGTQGPVRDIITDPAYFDITLPPHVESEFPAPAGHTAFVYVFEGGGVFGSHGNFLPIGQVERRMAVLFDEGENISVKTDWQPMRFLLVTGKPIGEPIAWQGPIVMNTQQQLRTAFEEYNTDRFIKFKPGLK